MAGLIGLKAPRGGHDSLPGSGSPDGQPAPKAANISWQPSVVMTLEMFATNAKKTVDGKLSAAAKHASSLFGAEGDQSEAKKALTDAFKTRSFIEAWMNAKKLGAAPLPLSDESAAVPQLKAIVLTVMLDLESAQEGRSGKKGRTGGAKEWARMQLLAIMLTQKTKADAGKAWKFLQPKIEMWEYS